MLEQAADGLVRASRTATRGTRLSIRPHGAWVATQPSRHSNATRRPGSRMTGWRNVRRLWLCAGKLDGSAPRGLSVLQMSAALRELSDIQRWL
jgi:hypothetical protein